MTKWKFQDEAVTKTVKSLKKNRRAQLIMPCGSGKTRVGLRVLEKLGHRKNLVILPSLALVEQTVAEYESHAKGKFDTLVVCSDGGINDPEEVAAFLRRRGPRIVFCAYQSGDVLEGLKFDFAIYDEAHKTAGEEDKFFAYTMHDDNVHIGRRLFVTATPRRTKITEDGKKVCFSMDNPDVYGDVAFRMSFREAIKLGVICDYQIVVSVVLDDHLEVENAPKPLAVALSKAMKKTGAKKAFSYHLTIDDAKRFSEENRKCFPGFKVKHVSGDMSLKDRGVVMNDFRGANKSLMTNAKCLTEGVDVPSVDMVAFTHPKRSAVDIVQAVGRATRVSDGKERGNVFVPLLLRKGEDIEDGLERTRFDYLYNVMQAMKDQDEVFAEALKQYASGEREDLGEFVSVVGPAEVPLGRLRAALGARIVGTLFSYSALNKEKLLKKARAGADRPASGTRLGVALAGYCVYKKSGCYDPVFDKKIRKTAPGWFEKSSDRNKKELLDLARAGAARPEKRKHQLGRALISYTAANSTSFDPAFKKNIQKIAPQWFERTADKTKVELLALAKRGEKRPKQPGRLGNSLSNYINGPNADVIFKKKLQTLAPHWFEKTSSTTKKKLLEMARAGTNKPTRPSKLGDALRRYTRNGECQDLVFKKEIKKLAPHWFKC